MKEEEVLGEGLKVKGIKVGRLRSSRMTLDS